MTGPYPKKKITPKKQNPNPYVTGRVQMVGFHMVRPVPPGWCSQVQMEFSTLRSSFHNIVPTKPEVTMQRISIVVFPSLPVSWLVPLAFL